MRGYGRRNYLCLFVLAGLVLGFAATATDRPIDVRIDFGKYAVQLGGPDGASVCQFHGVKPDGSSAAARVVYSSLQGFPDDSPSTDFGRFCDVAFSGRSPKGMALGQVWVTPCPLQSPPGSLGDHYSPSSWDQLDMTMYEPVLLPRERFTNEKATGPIYGHTATMLVASLRRARAEGRRVVYWTDVHTDFPSWMWTDGLRKNPVQEQYWEEAALHTVYFIKYLVARHGVPIHAASFANEPDLPARHGFKPAQLIRCARILRQKLDEAGLTGVKVLPFTSVSINKVNLSWVNTWVDYLNETTTLLNGDMREYQADIDYLGGHISNGEEPLMARVPNTPLWRASGDFNEHWRKDVGFDMGPDDQIDEITRYNAWLYGRGVSQAGIWQVASRMGLGDDFFYLGQGFDPDRFGRRVAIDGAASVNPYVQPGMFRVADSMGAAAASPYSVDGFGGRGRKEVIVITNSAIERTFRIRTEGLAGNDARVYQATSREGKKELKPVRLKDQVLTIGVPADSVTAVVFKKPGTRPRVYLVVADPKNLTPQEQRVRDLIDKSAEILAVGEHLSQAEKDQYACKRHPIDAMGAAGFVLSDSIRDQNLIRAYKTVMAPVLAVGQHASALVGLKEGSTVEAGQFLPLRDELDPPAPLLDSGLPRACGLRIAADPGVVPPRFLDAIR